MTKTKNDCLSVRYFWRKPTHLWEAGSVCYVTHISSPMVRSGEMLSGLMYRVMIWLKMVEPEPKPTKMRPPIRPRWLGNHWENETRTHNCNNQLPIKDHDQFPARIVQELCESRGGRPGLSVLTSLLVSVDVKIYWTVLRHWSQLVPNMSIDIWGH